MKQVITLFLSIISLLAYSQDTCKTTKSGKWSDKSVWENYKIPSEGSYIIVQPQHILTADISTVVSGIEVNKTATLQAIQSKSVVLSSTGNIKIHGQLKIIPTSSSVTTTIKFIGVNQNNFIGGGMEILDSDIGLWITGNVEIVGSKKTAWTTLANSAMAGDTAITVKKISGWKIGDDITISPTSKKETLGFFTQFDTRKIKSITGNKIILNSPLSFDHLSVQSPFKPTIYYAEVMNLTRNISIEGTDSGKAHINFLMSGKQRIQNAQIVNMGPRRGPPGKSVEVLGRYSLHFHHCGTKSKGTIVEGVVVKKGGSHSFVFHASDSILSKNNISFDTFEEAFWWDFPPDNSTLSTNDSHDITYDSCVAALVKSDPPQKGYRLAGFVLGSGTGNTVKNCISVGIQGNNGAAGFLWPESSNYTPNTWTFHDNIAHNNRTDAIFTWQNDTSHHQIVNFTGYNNGKYGIEHGAYHNAYHYKDIDLFGNQYSIFLHATAIPKIPYINGYCSSFTNINSTDSLFITIHTLPGEPTLFLNCKFPGIIVSELPARVKNPPGGLYDFVNSTVTENNISIVGMETGSRIRIQNMMEAIQITKDKTEKIPLFFPQ